MKNIVGICCAVLIITVSGSVMAGEYPQNPDRFPSIGLQYTGIGQEGDYKVVGLKQDAEFSSGTLLLDTRIPVSNSLTLNAGLGLIGSSLKTDASPALAGDEYELGGAVLTFGARYYFNR